MSASAWSAWWSLPGPGSYLDAAIDVLRQGRCLVLALPQHSPPGLAEALAIRVSEDPIWRWTPVEARAQELPAAGVIRACWPPGEGPDALSALVREARLQDRVLWLGALEPDQADAWLTWMGDFASASHHVPPRDRPTCVGITVGIAPPASLGAVPGIAVLPWRDRLDALDLQSWAAHLERATERAPLERALRHELIAALAGADPALALALADLSIVRLLEPDAALEAFASARGWDVSAPPQDWEAGVLDSVGGTSVVHAAALPAGTPRSRAVHERLWRAQVRVLFPLIEGERRRLIEEHRSLLSVPYYIEGRNDPIRRIEDLEIVHLLHQLRGRIEARRESLLYALHRARNALAHLEILGAIELTGLLQLIRR